MVISSKRDEWPDWWRFGPVEITLSSISLWFGQTLLIGQCLVTHWNYDIWLVVWNMFYFLVFFPIWRSAGEGYQSNQFFCVEKSGLVPTISLSYFPRNIWTPATISTLYIFISTIYIYIYPLSLIPYVYFTKLWKNTIFNRQILLNHPSMATMSRSEAAQLVAFATLHRCLLSEQQAASFPCWFVICFWRIV